MRKRLLTSLLAGCLLTGCDAVVKPPQQKKLTGLQAQKVTFPFRCPRGESFRLLLAVPEAKVNLLQPNVKFPKSPTFQGQIVITQQGKQICSLPISSANTNRSNWLAPYGFEGGYIIHTSPVPKNQDFGLPLDKYLKSGQDYQVAINFLKQPPKNTSLWLSWLGKK